MGRDVQNKNRSRHGKGGIIAHYCAIPTSQPPFIAYNIAQYIFPTTPFIAIKYWQYLVRAKSQDHVQGYGVQQVTWYVVVADGRDGIRESEKPWV